MILPPSAAPPPTAPPFAEYPWTREGASEKGEALLSESHDSHRAVVIVMIVIVVIDIITVIVVIVIGCAPKGGRHSTTIFNPQWKLGLSSAHLCSGGLVV